MTSNSNGPGARAGTGCAMVPTLAVRPASVMTVLLITAVTITTPRLLCHHSGRGHRRVGVDGGGHRGCDLAGRHARRRRDLEEDPGHRHLDDAARRHAAEGPTVAIPHGRVGKTMPRGEACGSSSGLEGLACVVGFSCDAPPGTTKLRPAAHGARMPW